MLEYGLFLFFPFLMIYAAASDLFTMTISNKVSILLIAGFMFFAWMTGLSLSDIAWHWAAFGIVLLFGFSFFAFGVMGGGDVKLMATTALWFGWSSFFVYLLLASVLGGFLVFAFLIGRSQFVPGFIGRIEWVRRLYNHQHVPYGITLGLAAMMLYPYTPWMQQAMEISLSK